MLACEELTKLVDCGSEPVRSTSMSLPFFRHLGRDLDVGTAVAVIVEQRFTVEHAVLPGRHHGAGLLLGGIENGLDRGFDGLRAELAEQL